MRCAIAALFMEQAVVGAIPLTTGGQNTILRVPQKDVVKMARLARNKNPNPGKQSSTANNALANSQSALALTKDQRSATQTRIRDAAQELRRIEDELERSEPEDSPLARAKSRFATAQEAHKVAEDRMHQSPEYRAAIENLSPNVARRADDLSELHASMVSRDERVSLAASELSEAREEYQSLRKNLLQEDSGWTAAAERLKTLRGEQAAAETEVRKARAAKNLVEEQIKRAQREAQLAEIRKRQVQIQKQRAAQIQKALQVQAQRRRSHTRHR